ncbi:MAG TPA: WcaI family glycosyltransferase [Flavisolibacter sp.]|nr:WcaI family glycosyltransferase [Flavisolibacter sp.]
MGKRILLISGNFLPEPTGIGKYNGEMIQWFANNGYECTVITTAPYYPFWKVQEPYKGKWFKREHITTEGKSIEVYRCPHYVPATPSGVNRLLSEVSFSATSLLVVLRMLAKRRFNYVVTVVPPFQLGFHALLYKLFRGAKLVYHVQDLQIEAARDLRMIKSKNLINLLFKLERNILKRSDLISSISPAMIKQLQDKANKAIEFFPNWVDTASFFPIDNKAKLKESFGFKATDKVVLYSGAIGEKQGLEMILKSAKKLQEEIDVKFIICGTGPYMEKLRQLVEAEKVSSVHLSPLQPQERFSSFLNMADVHLVIQKASAGDLVMPSKLSTILAVGGLALVTAAEGTSLYNIIKEHGIGLVVEPENEKQFIATLSNAIKNNYSDIQIRARKYAVEILSTDNVLSRFEHCLAQLG